MKIELLTNIRQSFISKRNIPHISSEYILDVSNLVVQIEQHSILEEISFKIPRGDRVALVGPNGAGKSTLFKCIVGSIHPTSGSVVVGGHDPSGHICIAYMPQRSKIDWTYPVTVRDVVMMGRVGKIGFLKWAGAQDRKIVSDCLKLVDLLDISNSQINRLSGGQQQRMLIAQAIAQESELILMDEPFDGLDIPSREKTLEILSILSQRDVTIMIATHDLELASEVFDQVILLNRKLLGIGKSKDVFTKQNLIEAFGDHLQIVQTENGALVLSEARHHG